MRLIGMLAAIAAMLFVPAASAKEITKVTACGADQCVTTRDPAILQGLMNGGPPTVPPNAGNPVIRLRATVTEPGQGAVAHFTSWWVPASRLLIGEDGTWMRLAAQAERSLQRVTRELAPLPASRIGISIPDATPAPTPAAAHRSSGGGSESGWLLMVVGLVVAAAVGAVLVLWRRHKSRSAVTGDSAPGLSQFPDTV